MNWCKSLTAALIAVVALTQVPSGAQSPPNIPPGNQLSPVPSGSARPRVQQGPVSFIGLTYQILPFNPQNSGFLQDLGGWIVGEPIGGRLYSLARVQTSSGQFIGGAEQGQKQMLWLQAILPPDSQGRVSYKVLDIINLPQIQPSDVLVGSPGQPCVQNGVANPELVAIARYDDRNYLRQIKRAWRANRTAGKFQEVSAGNIVCDNRSVGYR